jgi:hypothetical protein
MTALHAAVPAGQVNVGKGGSWLFPYLLAKFQLQPSRTAVVGDRLDTDIAMGKQGDLVTLLPLTGEQAARRARMHARLTACFVLLGCNQLACAAATYYSRKQCSTYQLVPASWYCSPAGIFVDAQGTRLFSYPRHPTRGIKSRSWAKTCIMVTALVMDIYNTPYCVG